MLYVLTGFLFFILGYIIGFVVCKYMTNHRNNSREINEIIVEESTIVQYMVRKDGI